MAITGLLPSDKLLYSLTPVAGDLVQFTREFLEASNVMVGSCGRALPEIRGVTAKYWAPGGKDGSNNGDGNKSDMAMEAQI